MTSYIQVDTRLSSHADRITRLERIDRERDAEPGHLYQRRHRWRNILETDRRVAKKIIEITGTVKLQRGSCTNPNCKGAKHGTIVVTHKDGTVFQICPIAYYLRRWLSALRNDELSDFMKKNKMEDFLEWCESGHKKDTENTQLLSGVT